MAGKLFLRQKRTGIHRANHGHGARREKADDFEFCRVSASPPVLQAGPYGSVPEGPGEEGTALWAARLGSVVWGLEGSLGQHFASKVLMHWDLWWFL